MRSESKSNSRPDWKVTWMPSPTRSTIAPGMFCSSSFACWSIWWPMTAPTVPPTAAPMIAPFAVEPFARPTAAPAAPPTVAPMTAPFSLLESDAHPLIASDVSTSTATPRERCTSCILPPLEGVVHNGAHAVPRFRSSPNSVLGRALRARMGFSAGAVRRICRGPLPIRGVAAAEDPIRSAAAAENSQRAAENS